MTRPVHPKTVKAAKAFAKQTLKTDVKVRRASKAETLKALVKKFDNERAADVVVATDRRGLKVLLTVEDQHATRQLNHESAIATSIGLIPVVGPFIAAALALKDIIKSSIHLGKAKSAGHDAAPSHRALMRMGVKHLGVSAASVASHGVAHQVMAAVEVAATAKDLVDAKPTWRTLPKSLLTALEGLFSVHHHQPDRDTKDLTVELVEVLDPGKPPKVSTKGAGNPEVTAGPPSRAASPKKTG